VCGISLSVGVSPISSARLDSVLQMRYFWFGRNRQMECGAQIGMGIGIRL
jgi:hypothetical protein